LGRTVAHTAHREHVTKSAFARRLVPGPVVRGRSIAPAFDRSSSVSRSVSARSTITAGFPSGTACRSRSMARTRPGASLRQRTTVACFFSRRRRGSGIDRSRAVVLSARGPRGGRRCSFARVRPAFARNPWRRSCRARRSARRV